MPKREPAPDIPDIDKLPPTALLTQLQVSRLSGFAPVTIRLWATRGTGPKVTRINGHLPRYMVRDVRAWLDGRHAEA